MDTALIDEWAFAPHSVRVRPPGRLVAAVLGVFAAALVGFLVLRAGEDVTPEPQTDVLGVTQTRAARSYVISAKVLFEIVDRHEDGSAVVDMTVSEVLAGGGPDLGSTTLRLGVAPEGRLGSVTGLADGLALDPSTSSNALVGDLSGDEMTAGHSWTSQVELKLVDG